MRAPFQTLIIPYKIENNEIFYGIFLRRKQNIWQFIAGGGEDLEKPIETAIRELKEEINIVATNNELIVLDTKSTIPVVNITGEFTWGKNIYVVPEYTFGIDISQANVKISSEHKEFIWVKYRMRLSI